MSSICSNTLLKNSADFVEPCLKSVLPYVDRAIVSVDRTSTDGTIEIMERMAKENPKIDLDFYEISEPNTDLPKQRERQLKKTTEDWVWIVDDDEYYLPSDAVKLKELADTDTEHSAFALRAWFAIDEKHYHPYRGQHKMERIFRNKPSLHWTGLWSKEAIYDGTLWLSHYLPEAKVLQIHDQVRYLHFSYLKNYTWRTAFGAKKFHYPKMSEEEISNYPVFPQEMQEIIKLCLK